MKPAARRLPRGADALYAGPLDAFVAARAALEKRLRAAGETAAAAEVKRLEKPSISAWAVNQLWRAEREDFARLLGSRSALEKASRAGDAVAVREAARAQSTLVAGLRRRASELLVEATHGSSPGVLGRVTTTLRALAARGSFAPEAVGALTRDVEPSGFDAFGGLALGAFPRKKAIELDEGSPPLVARTKPTPKPKPAPKAKAAKHPPTGATKRAAAAKARAAKMAADARLREVARKAAAQARELARLEAKLVKARDALARAKEQVRALEARVAHARRGGTARA